MLKNTYAGRIEKMKNDARAAAHSIQQDINLGNVNYPVSEDARKAIANYMSAISSVVDAKKAQENTQEKIAKRSIAEMTEKTFRNKSQYFQDNADFVRMTAAGSQHFVKGLLEKIQQDDPVGFFTDWAAENIRLKREHGQAEKAPTLEATNQKQPEGPVKN